MNRYKYDINGRYNEFMAPANIKIYEFNDSEFNEKNEQGTVYYIQNIKPVVQIIFRVDDLNDQDDGDDVILPDAIMISKDYAYKGTYSSLSECKRKLISYWFTMYK